MLTTMKAKAGDRIVVESEKVQQPAREGTIEEVVQEEPPRFRVRWDDGRESILAPSAGSARVEAVKKARTQKSRSRARA
jgi:hypothetical protein